MSKKIKILFVYTNPLKIPYIDLGIASLSAYIKKEGYSTKLIDFTFNKSLKQAIKELKSYNPQIVCFSSRSGEFEEVVKLATKFRKNHKAIYLCGGIHPTISPEEVISRDCFDGIGIGEGEISISEFLKKIVEKSDYSLTKGFWFKKEGKIIKNPINKLIEDLDTLPLIDYGLFDIENYLKVRGGQLDYVSARGCPFRCTYCVNHTLIELNAGKGVYSRRKSAEKIISEIKYILKKYPLTKSLKIADEHFIINKKRLGELSKKYSSIKGPPFECDARADACDKETIKFLKKMGCSKLNIAIESGDEGLRNKILNKRISNAQIIRAFELARKYHIHTMSFNMVGLPFETKEQIKKTIDLNKKVMPDSIQASIFTPFEGTYLRKFCIEKGILTNQDIEKSYYSGNYLKNPNISHKELKNIARKFSYYCYKDRSLIKAYFLLLRDTAIPYYVKYSKYIPDFIKRVIYFIFWNLKFISK